MNAEPQTNRDLRFAIGLFAGTCLGAGLAIWLAPRLAAELSDRVIGTARSLRTQASEGYQQVSRRTGDVIGAITRQAQDVRDDVANAVARGGHEVERFATEAKSDRVNEGRRDAAAKSAAGGTI
jgi:gas vesicle protein